MAGALPGEASGEAASSASASAGAEATAPEANKYYKLQLAGGHFLGGSAKSSKGARRLQKVTAATAGIFLLEEPAKEKHGRRALFLVDGGYLRADAKCQPIATTSAKKGALGWERFHIKAVAGGFNIVSHHGTALASSSDGWIYGSKDFEGPALTVQFVLTDEPSAGLTRFVSSDSGEPRAKKRRKVSESDAIGTSGATSSPAVSPLLPSINRTPADTSEMVSVTTVHTELKEIYGDVLSKTIADAWLAHHSAKACSF